MTVAVVLGPESSKVKSKTFCADAHIAQASTIKSDKAELSNLVFIELTPKLRGKIILSGELFVNKTIHRISRTGYRGLAGNQDPDKRGDIQKFTTPS